MLFCTAATLAVCIGGLWAADMLGVWRAEERASTRNVRIKR